MSYVYLNLFPAMWLAWVLIWVAFSHNVKTTVRREPIGSRLLHVVPLVLAGVLIFLPQFPIAILARRFLPLSDWPFWCGAVLALGGFLFTIWARIHIGRNWSGTVTLKEGHELVKTGPYRWVRHPIYTGLLLAFIGSAIARAEWRGILAVALAMAALWRKLRMEERWMREQFGRDYEEYSRQVAALIPFIL
jgi:protein-S-isoprenylcysteine O-methyltransferase Ste14